MKRKNLPKSKTVKGNIIPQCATQKVPSTSPATTFTETKTPKKCAIQVK